MVSGCWVFTWSYLSIPESARFGRPARTFFLVSHEFARGSWLVVTECSRGGLRAQVSSRVVLRTRTPTLGGLRAQVPSRVVLRTRTPTLQTV